MEPTCADRNEFEAAVVAGGFTLLNERGDYRYFGVRGSSGRQLRSGETTHCYVECPSTGHDVPCSPEIPHADVEPLFVTGLIRSLATAASSLVEARRFVAETRQFLDAGWERIRR